MGPYKSPFPLKEKGGFRVLSGISLKEGQSKRGVENEIEVRKHTNVRMAEHD
jgi:hypothetical protein